MTSRLCILFFLSGAAALLFETLWFYQTGLLLGNTIWSSSLVLSSFMGGLALGNLLTAWRGEILRQPVRLYAALEILIGITGYAIVQVLPQLTPWLSPLLGSFVEIPWALNAIRLVIAFLLLMVPTTAMGATLPLLVQALFRRDPHFGQVLGRLYGWNTLGAVIGAIAGELVLYRWFGIKGTAAMATLLNVCVAFMALKFVAVSEGGETTTQVRHDPPAPQSLSPQSKTVTACLVAAFFSGAILLALEVVWFRILLIFVLGTGLTFAFMLGIVLAGIGLGGLLGTRWLSARPEEALRSLPLVAIGNGVLCIVTYVLLTGVLEVHRQWPLRSYTVFAFGLPLMFPVSLLSGVLFPLLGEWLHREMGGAIRVAGRLVLANTTGAMCGSLIAAFILLPRLGFAASLKLLAVAYGLVGIVLLFGNFKIGRGRVLLVVSAFGFLIAGVIGAPLEKLRDRSLAVIQGRWLRVGELPIALREGLTETIVYLRKEVFGQPLYHRLITNNVAIASSKLLWQRYMKLFVYLPASLHPNPRRALLICYGIGNTASALTKLKELETIDIVDVSRDVIELGRLAYPDPATYPLDDRRVRVHIEDGRFFLQTTTEQFDLITGEPPPPQSSGVVSLYTREYFTLLRNRLTEGGMLTYWLPVHLLFERDVKNILRAFCDVFKNCSLWNGAGQEWILMGTRDAREPVTVAQFTRLWKDPLVRADLETIGVERPEQLGALFIADADTLHSFLRDARPLIDDRPKRLSHAPPWRGEDDFSYRSWMDVAKTRERFLTSRVISELWPEPMRAVSIPYFDTQQLINQFFLENSGSVVNRLAQADLLLVRTNLRTLPLWLFGSEVGEQRAVDKAVASGVRSADIDYARGLRALANRDYARAAKQFALLEGQLREAFYYRIYAHAMAGQMSEAKRLLVSMDHSHPSKALDQQFLNFMAARFRSF